MKYLIKSNPNHATFSDGTEIRGEIPSTSDKRQYIHQTEIPHFLNVNPRLGKVSSGVLSMIIPSNMPLDGEDIIQNEYGFEAMIVEVLERRPARGSWGERKPHFVKVKYL